MKFKYPLNFTKDEIFAAKKRHTFEHEKCDTKQRQSSLEEDLRRKAEQQLAQEISKKESEMNEIIRKKEVSARLK